MAAKTQPTSAGLRAVSLCHFRHAWSDWSAARNFILTRYRLGWISQQTEPDLAHLAAPTLLVWQALYLGPKQERVLPTGKGR